MWRYISFVILFLSSLASATPLVIAHRGASGYLPEHTLASKAMAHSMGVAYIEQDVVLTKDLVPIILHDIHLDTVSDVAELYPNHKRKDGRYYAIDFTWAELKHLSLTERFNPKTGERYFPKRFPSGKSKFRIASLTEEIELIEGLNTSTGREIGLYIELKQPEFHLAEKKDIVPIVMAVLKKHGYEKETSFAKSSRPRVYLQCFHAATLQRIKKDFKTNIPLVQLIADNSWGESTTDYQTMLTDKGLAEVATYATGIGPWIPQLFNDKGLSTPLVSLARKYKLVIHAYTARADQLPPQLKSFAELHHLLFKVAKIDGVFSDHPDQSVEWIKANF